MTKSVTTSAITEVSKFAYNEALKSLGFKRIGNHLFRPSHDLFHGIHFQASRWGSLQEGSFTINLIVTSESLYKFYTGSPLPRNPATALFPIQQRIGRLLPQRQTYWWSITSNTDVGALCREVTSALTQYALPFFADYPDSSALLNRLRQGKGLPGLAQPVCRLAHAMLAREAGCLDEATAQIRTLITEAGTSDRILLIASRIGIPYTL
ncbi:MAG: DUF4304 domain-containing protein [Caldilineaceae bacterium]